MKYTKDEAFAEVMRRGRKMKIQYARRKKTVISASLSFVMAAVVIAIGWLKGAAGGVNGQSAYGSFLLPTQAGGYVLAAVIAFTAGIGVTLGIQKYRNNRDNKDRS